MGSPDELTRECERELDDSERRHECGRVRFSQPAAAAAPSVDDPEIKATKRSAEVLEIRRLGDIPHRTLNPVQRPNTAGPGCAKFDLRLERGFLAVQNVKSAATVYEYEWLAPAISYLSDSLAALQQVSSSPEITGVKTQQSLAVGLEAVNQVFLHLEARLDYLKLLGELGASQPALVRFVENELNGPLNRIPCSSNLVQTAVGRYSEKHSAAVLTSAANKTVTGEGSSSGSQRGGGPTETSRSGGGRGGGVPKSPPFTRSKGRATRQSRDPSPAPSQRGE